MKYPGRIAVLMYHGLDSPANPSEMTRGGDFVYVVDIQDFEKQMAYLADSKKPVITLTDDDLKDDGPDIRVVLTFDDGHMTNYTMAMPIMEKLGFKGHFFITTDYIGKPHFMARGMIKDLYRRGMSIGSHGKTHGFLTDLDDKELRNELEESKARLEEIIDARVVAFSAPGGRIDKRVCCFLKDAGYRIIFDSNPVFNSPADRGVIGRFAVQRGLGFSSFSKIVSGNPPLLSSLKYSVLKNAKVMLGNGRYHSIRNIVKGTKG